MNYLSSSGIKMCEGDCQQADMDGISINSDAPPSLTSSSSISRLAHSASLPDLYSKAKRDTIPTLWQEPRTVSQTSSPGKYLGVSNDSFEDVFKPNSCRSQSEEQDDVPDVSPNWITEIIGLPSTSNATSNVIFSVKMPKFPMRVFRDPPPIFS